NRAIEVYTENPELYSGYQNVKTGKILAIIGTVLCAIYIIIIIAALAIYGIDGLEDMQQEWARQYEGGL
ncbi:MAG TPA: CCC motif membrane protein, partial [Salinimicrobium sp.]|nr:CCC motif membrane protein [Salinimicrobium sp.]